MYTLFSFCIATYHASSTPQEDHKSENIIYYSTVFLLL